jgi:hypothetical protein
MSVDTDLKKLHDKVSAITDISMNQPHDENHVRGQACDYAQEIEDRTRNICFLANKTADISKEIKKLYAVFKKIAKGNEQSNPMLLEIKELSISIVNSLKKDDPTHIYNERIEQLNSIINSTVPDIYFLERLPKFTAFLKKLSKEAGEIANPPAKQGSLFSIFRRNKNAVAPVDNQILTFKNEIDEMIDSLSKAKTFEDFNLVFGGLRLTITANKYVIEKVSQLQNESEQMHLSSSDKIESVSKIIFETMEPVKNEFLKSNLGLALLNIINSTHEHYAPLKPEEYNKIAKFSIYNHTEMEILTFMLSEEKFESFIQNLNKALSAYKVKLSPPEGNVKRLSR